MKVAPLIHTRTFNCDFNPKFLVRPTKFDSRDIDWARKNVLGATSEIDGLQGVRWLVVNNETYRIAGVVGFLKDICSKCQLSKEDKQKSEKLFYDNKGRSIYAFIGVVIDNLNNKDYKVVDYEYLWKSYIDKVEPIWKRSYQESIEVPFNDIKVELENPPKKSIKNEEEGIKVGPKLLLETNQDKDYKFFINYLCMRNQDEFSFCSNLTDYNTVKQSNFSIITTSSNIITRIERDINKKKEKPLIENSIENLKPSSQKKKLLWQNSRNYWKIVVLSVILIVLLMISYKAGQLSQQNLNLTIILWTQLY